MVPVMRRTSSALGPAAAKPAASPNAASPASAGAGTARGASGLDMTRVIRDRRVPLTGAAGARLGGAPSRVAETLG